MSTTARGDDHHPGQPPGGVNVDPKIETVQAVYAAFGTGDVEAILNFVTDDIDWASEAEATGVVPWYGVHKGKAELPSFFKAIGESTEVTEFTPVGFAAGENEAMSVVRYGFTVRSNGRSGTMQIHHWWRFRGDLIEQYRGSEDTELTTRLFGA
jgi:hypothetical protein